MVYSNHQSLSLFTIHDYSGVFPWVEPFRGGVRTLLTLAVRPGKKPPVRRGTERRFDAVPVQLLGQAKSEKRLYV